MTHHEDKTIVVYGVKTCPDTIRSKSWLDGHGIPYRWVDVDTDREGYDFVVKLNNGRRTVPTIVFVDGSFLVEPTEEELDQKLGG